ncbi:hypothetical protein [Streptomyces lydicus]|uniref:hypothetical protein n=1 Tax=Streptomyces lydicus TaxID=47763 RepID=UPI00101371A3|nr:hypothetical protein [Streptomyces lydicus]MCZ1012022.1 hypothetical protein [Streptomyces lydicus]
MSNDNVLTAPRIPHPTGGTGTRSADHLRTAHVTLAETRKHNDPADRAAIADMAGAYVAAALLHARETDLTAL